jgi:hypothetical protein
MKTEKFEGEFIVEEHAFRDKREGRSPSEFLRDTTEQGGIGVEHAVTPAPTVSGIACMGFPGEGAADASPGGPEVTFSVAHGEGAFFDILIYSSTAAFVLLASTWTSSVSFRVQIRPHPLGDMKQCPRPQMNITGCTSNILRQTSLSSCALHLRGYSINNSGADPCAFFQHVQDFPSRVDTEPPVRIERRQNAEATDFAVPTSPRLEILKIHLYLCVLASVNPAASGVGVLVLSAS